MNQQRFTWDEKKRQANLKKHGLDFAHVERVFGYRTYTYEDKRYAYSEQRYITLGYLGESAVQITYTETAHEIHIITFRPATRRENATLFAYTSF